MSKDIFSATSNLQRGVALLNSLDASKFPLLVVRISQKLHIKDEHAFTEEEEVKLLSTFKVSAEDLDLVIETCEFVFQQAAYHSLQPSVLKDHLCSLQLSEDKANAIAETWAACEKDVIDHLKQHSFTPKKLEGVSWKLSLTMAQSLQAKLKQPNAQFQFRLHSDNTGENENVRVEFSHDELYRFYNQLEAVQSQLDSLS